MQQRNTIDLAAFSQDIFENFQRCPLECADYQQHSPHILYVNRKGEAKPKLEKPTLDSQGTMLISLAAQLMHSENIVRIYEECFHQQAERIEYLEDKLRGVEDALEGDFEDE